MHALPSVFRAKSARSTREILGLIRRKGGLAALFADNSLMYDNYGSPGPPVASVPSSSSDYLYHPTRAWLSAMENRSLNAVLARFAAEIISNLHEHDG